MIRFQRNSFLQKIPNITLIKIRGNKIHIYMLSIIHSFIVHNNRRNNLFPVYRKVNQHNHLMHTVAFIFDCKIRMRNDCDRIRQFLIDLLHSISTQSVIIGPFSVSPRPNGFLFCCRNGIDMIRRNRYRQRI